MNGLIGVTILLLIIIGIVVICYLVVRKKISEFTMKYFGTSDLKEAIEKSEIEASNTPKSLASMESLILPRLKKDFPNLNVNELKRMAEEAILRCLEAIEKGSSEELKYGSDKVKAWVDGILEDTKGSKVVIDKMVIHKTVINRYEKVDGIASLYLQSGVEYFYKEKDKIGKKIQDRFEVEFIYVIDASKVDVSKKVLGLNCPNCGSPVTSLSEKTCSYCGSIVQDIVKRVWTLNNIKRF